MRRFLFLPAFAFLLAPLSAGADVQFGSHDRLQTRFGPAQVVGEIGARQLTVLEQTMPLDRAHTWDILGAWGMEGADHDWLLAQQHHGGNMCGPGITVVRVSPAEIRIMGETGACEGAVRDLRVLPDALEMDIFADGLRQQVTTYRFDAQGMTTTAGAEPFTAAPAGPGADATRWIGQHPYRPFEDPSERARFLTILSEDQIRDLANRIGPANSVVQRGDWVLGAGCMAHACNLSAGAWGIRISDGAPAAAVFDQGAPARRYGPAANDPVFAGWIAEHSL